VTGRERSVLVVGAGMFGIASATALKERGWRVTVLDPGPLPRVEAASTDISKVVRMDYGSDALLTDLMESAIPRWLDWNRRWDAELYHEVGFLLLARQPMAAGGFEHACLQTLNARGHAVRRLDAAALREWFPAWNAALYPDGYLNPAAGFVESGRALSRMIDDARAAGVAIRTGDRVARLDEEGGLVRGVVTAAGERVTADLTLVAAGAWTPVLLPHLREVMWPVAQPVFHLAPADPSAWRPPRFTVWAADIAATGWYGFPANENGIVKIANHGPGRRVDPDAPRTIAKDDEDRLRAFLRESLPGLAGATLAASKTCLYCDSFDGDFWIGLDRDVRGLAVAAGDSGHGFKFAPVLGEIVADAIEGVPNRFAARFAPRAPAGRKTEEMRFGMS
jgi:glycine/D-amino acid oxidase-like deaminating enzyme